MASTAAARRRLAPPMCATAAVVAVAVTGCSSADGDSAGTSGATGAAAAAAQSDADESGSPEPKTTTGDGELVVSYKAAKTAADRGARKFLEDTKVLQNVADFADARIELPYDVPLRAKSCGFSNAYWSSETKDITYCYEFDEEMRPLLRSQETQGSKADRAKATNQDMVGLTNGVLLHELGHGLIDMYDLPVTGKEEDAVDQLATLMLTSGDEKHMEYALDTVNAWGVLADAEAAGDLSGQFSDEHSLNAQRFYNEICWVYGSDTKMFADVVRTKDNPDGVLPEERAAGCPDEYDQINKSWSTLLQPYLKD